MCCRNPIDKNKPMIDQHVMCSANGCGQLFTMNKKILRNYFRNDEPHKCQGCGVSIDIFQALTRSLNYKDSVLMKFGIYPLGTKALLLQKNIRKNEVLTIDLHAEGLPPKGKILRGNCTVQCSDNNGRIQPLLIHGNILPIRALPSEISFFGRPCGQNPPDECPITLMFPFVTEDLLEIPFQNLVDGIEYYSQKRLQPAVIACNAAVEFALREFFSELLAKKASSVSKKKRQSFWVKLPDTVTS